MGFVALYVTKLNMATELGPFSLETPWRAWMDVQQRAIKAAKALEAAGVLYAIAGGNAVAAWVARVDPDAVRATVDVDVLIRRSDFEAARIALESAGFVHRHVAGIDAFLEPPGNRFRSGIHLLFAGEKVRESEPATNPDVVPAEQADHFKVLSLQSLVQVKLTAFRRKDQVHLIDMIEVGLLDSTWPARFPPQLADRLQLLLDTPEG